MYIREPREASTFKVRIFEEKGLRTSVHAQFRARYFSSRLLSAKNRARDRERASPREKIPAEFAAIAAIAVAVNNAINRPASIAPNSAEIEIQVAVAAWMYRPTGCATSVAMAGKGKASRFSPLPPLRPFLSLSLGGQCVHPSNIRQIQMRRVASARRILSAAVISLRI